MDGMPPISRGIQQPSASILGKASLTESAASFGTLSPLSLIRSIYSTNDPAELTALFNQHYQFASGDPAAFNSALEEVYSRNDQVDISSLDPGVKMDRMKLAIRVMERCIFRLGEIKSGSKPLMKMLTKINEMKGDWRVGNTFHPLVYDALAKSHPGVLMDILTRGQLNDPEAAALSLMRQGTVLSQEQTRSIISSSKNPDRISLLYYVDDPRFKLEVLRDELKGLEGGYEKKCWREREVINVLASFPEGRAELEVMRSRGEIDLVNIGGIYFGALSGSGISAAELGKFSERIAACAGLINKANESFGGRERIFYVDVSPNEVNGQQMNSAGWGDNSLNLTIGTLSNSSDRAVSFLLLHEACERQFSHGIFSSELGRTYISALGDNGPKSLIETFRLGKRIGGANVDSGLGHPWDSEREWLAETASAAIIGEPLPNNAMTAMNSARKLFRKS